MASDIESNRIIAVNFGDMSNNYLLDAQNLHDHIIEQLTDEMNYIFLDEVQLVPEFERVLDSLCRWKLTL